MLLLLIFAFFSGLITIAAPCIWPILPVILSASATGGKRKPLGVTLGVCLSFAFFTLTLSYIVKIIPFDPNVLRIFAVVVIGFLGLSLVIPAISARLEAFVSRLSGNLNTNPAAQGTGFKSGLITGLSLGLIWSPCAGPILATIATLAATRAVNFQIILVTIFYVLGIGIPLFLFSWLGQKLLLKSSALSRYTGRLQQAFGLIMILTAAAIYFNVDKNLEANLLNSFPGYSNFINQFESQVSGQLNQIKNQPAGSISSDQAQAPDFTGITNWINSKPLTLADLKGKVVLVDFWTYTCINCIRTLPFTTGWYEKYRDQGFMVVGVHTPEFEFEKNTQNVENAVKQYKITYPVAQDNDYLTWNAYQNQYWPAEYLIDANGKIRETNFGEGDYDKTEMEIKQLLQERGSTVDQSLIQMPDQTPQVDLSPETYLGLGRMTRFASPERPMAGIQTYTAAKNLQLHNFDYQGSWDLASEYAQSAENSVLDFNFHAGKVFLVITPKTGQDQVEVMVDGKSISPDQAGTDVVNGKLVLDQPRLYSLVDLTGKVESHKLTLNFKTPGIQVFAFTFGQ